VLILPVGATEPHGPHLPLSTDVIIAEGMAVRAARLLGGRGLTALVLPPIVYSVTDFAAGFAGALSLRFETARDVLVDVMRGAIRDGLRMLCVANSHLAPWHVDSIAAAIAAVEAESGIAIAFPDKRRRRWAAELTDEFRSGACHAGQYETSLVLADRPDLVRDAVRRALPSVDASLSTAIREGKQTFRAAGGNLANFGHPADASAAEGGATYDALAAMVVAAIEETYRLGEPVRD
jgi:creatinine amidohydrolase